MNENGPLPHDFAELLTVLAGGPNRRPQLAVDLNRSYWEVARWSRLNHVPDTAWADIMRLSQEKGLRGVDPEYLHKLSLKRGTKTSHHG